ncbi:hypothetical protein ACFT38_28195 [Streptomyces sp. NPDC056975]|uniref:hypothetical protein n=1 Tax=Streptomyces sp. NPDC056975 TaxID=3345985 RepID=UPI003643528B
MGHGGEQQVRAQAGELGCNRGRVVDLVVVAAPDRPGDVAVDVVVVDLDFVGVDRAELRETVRQGPGVLAQTPAAK